MKLLHIVLFFGIVLGALVVTPAVAERNNLLQTKSPAEVKSKPLLYYKSIKAPLPDIYKKIFNALENNGYFVIFEPNIGKNLEHFAQRWGKDYNRNKLEAIRSLVFCNAWYANAVSNADPKFTVLCPLHITLTHKQGLTQILFVRPSQVAQGSPAQAVALELEQDVIRAIESAVSR